MLAYIGFPYSVHDKSGNYSKNEVELQKTVVCVSSICVCFILPVSCCRWCHFLCCVQVLSSLFLLRVYFGSCLPVQTWPGRPVATGEGKSGRRPSKQDVLGGGGHPGCGSAWPSWRKSDVVYNRKRKRCATAAMRSRSEAGNPCQRDAGSGGRVYFWNAPEAASGPGRVGLKTIQGAGRRTKTAHLLDPDTHMNTHTRVVGGLSTVL